MKCWNILAELRRTVGKRCSNASPELSAVTRNFIYVCFAMPYVHRVAAEIFQCYTHQKYAEGVPMHALRGVQIMLIVVKLAKKKRPCCAWILAQLLNVTKQGVPNIFFLMYKSDGWVRRIGSRHGSQATLVSASLHVLMVWKVS